MPRGSWWNPLRYIDQASGGRVGDAFDSWLDPSADDTARAERQKRLDEFGNSLRQWSTGYGHEASKLGREANAERDYLRRIARGEESVSAEQLRQGLQQNVAGQMAMANSARPGQGAMAARNAAMNASRAASGLAGQQAIAGMQERQQAQQALQNAILQQRGQDLGAMAGKDASALQAWGAGQDHSQRGPSRNEKIFGGITDLTKVLNLLSDRELKTDIKEGDADADKLLRGLKSYRYRYKDAKHGEGDQLGIMAQDLEKLGLKQAIIETDEGKAVHAGKLAGALAATLPVINKRLEKLEGK